VQENNQTQGYLTKLSIDLDEISIIIDNLPVDKKQKLVQVLLGSQSGLVVTLNGSNIINNINNLMAMLNESSVEDIFNLLKNIPPQAIEKLIEAIALWVAQDRAAC
jgi:Mg/Co/Ni transporter MgtE